MDDACCRYLGILSLSNSRSRTKNEQTISVTVELDNIALLVSGPDKSGVM